MYMRPVPSDYDDWETVYGNKGWSSRELIPLLKKVCCRYSFGKLIGILMTPPKAETYQPNPNHPSHGSTGPLKISFASGHSNVGDEMVAVATAIEKDHHTTNDHNDFTLESINAWGVSQSVVILSHV